MERTRDLKQMKIHVLTRALLLNLPLPICFFYNSKCLSGHKSVTLSHTPKCPIRRFSKNWDSVEWKWRFKRRTWALPATHSHPSSQERNGLLLPRGHQSVWFDQSKRSTRTEGDREYMKQRAVLSICHVTNGDILWRLTTQTCPP